MFIPLHETRILIINQGGGLVLGLMCDTSRAKHEAVVKVAGVIAGSPCITLAKPLPSFAMWLVKQIVKVKPYMLYPIRNKPEVSLD